MKYIHARNRAILREMVVTDFKVRYQGSALGYLWSLLKPLFLFAILYYIFTFIMPIGEGVEHYAVGLLLGIVFWNFFSEATTIGASSIVSNGDLIRKISVPRYLVVLSSLFSALINLLLSLIIVFVFAILNGITPNAGWLLLPISIIELFIFSLGMSFILATAYVRYRDVTYIWEVFLQAGFYASAIIFPMSIVPSDLQKWFFINPMVQIIQDARQFLTPNSDIITLWDFHGVPFIKVAPFLIIIVSCVVGTIYFKRRSKYFAEEI